MGERRVRARSLRELKLVRNCRAHQAKTAGRQRLFCIGCMSDTVHAAAEFKGDRLKAPTLTARSVTANSALAARRGGRDDGLLTNGRKSGAFNVKTNDGSKAPASGCVCTSKRTLLPLLRNTVPTSPLASDLGMAIVVAGCGKAEAVPDQRCR